MMTAMRLATFACDTKNVPDGARESAIKAIFDLCSAAIAGLRTDGGTAARRAARSSWGVGPATMWFSSERLTVPGAAFANSAIASMVDLDDGHRAAAGHPGAAVIPAVLATAEATGANAEDVLTAIAIGYEIGVRISAARNFDDVDTLDSGLWCGQGVAAAAGWLRQLQPAAIANAIAIAGTTAPGLTATPYTRIMGNNVKEGIPWATAMALTAVDAAVEGFTGPIDLLDHDARYARSILVDGLGERWHIENTYFKPYGCCRWVHAAIDGVLAIQAEQGIAADEIVAIEIATFARTLTLNNDVAPKTIEAAQYSAPFCVALAAVRGAPALAPINEEALRDPEVLAFAPRVRLSVDSELDAMFSKSVPARIEVMTRNGRSVRTILEPKGEPRNPMTWPDLLSKFEAVAHTRMSPEPAAAFVDGIVALRQGNIGPLKAALAASLKSASAPRLVTAQAGE